MNNSSKTNTILLVILIVIALGILFFQVSRKTIFPQKQSGVEGTDQRQVAQNTKQNQVQNTEAIQAVAGSATTKSAISIVKPLPKYISIQEGSWPPVIHTSTKTYACTEGRIGMGAPTLTKQKTINGRVYCVSDTNEGAVGTIYDTYTYTTANESDTKTTKFTLSHQECGNFDESEMSICAQQKNVFMQNLDSMIASLF